MGDSQQDFSSVKSHIFHHKIALYGVLALLVIVTFGLIFVLKSLNKSTSQSSNAFTNSTNSVDSKNSIVPQDQYENPFDKDAQYVNPFSDYKNPFDSLK